MTDEPKPALPGAGPPPPKGEATSPEQPTKPAAGEKPAVEPPRAAKPPVPAKPKPPPAAPTGPPDPPAPDGVVEPDFLAGLRSAHGGAIQQVSYWVGDWTVIVAATSLLDVAGYLRDATDADFDYCSDVTATDWPPRPQRFDLIYCLYSTRHRHRVRLKVRAADREPVPSVTGLWPAANWLEREVYDLFGVNFTGHPDRRRLLMPDEWQGHPQRKDYPLEGPGEFLMENPQDWLRLRNLRDETEIE